MNITIPDYFTKAVSQYGESIALTDENGELSYQELDKKSDTVAAYLFDRGMKAGSVVAILMERSKESIVVMLGILKAGCTYMFIDKKYPKERIAYMVQDSEAELVISDIACFVETELAISDAGCSGKEKSVISNAVTYDEVLSQESSAYHPIEADGSRGAYLIYTSGSTGKPKGLMISHANFISLYEAWGKKHFSLEGQTQLNTAVIAPFVFDMCVFMIYTSLLCGHNLHIISEQSKQSGQGIISFLNRYHIDMMDVTPNYLRLMDNYLQYHKEEGFDVKRIFSIGDVLNLQLAKNIIHHAKYPAFQLYNTYGPAECTVLMTFFIMDKHNIDILSEVPIGEVTDNAAVKVVDEQLEEVKAGEVGELIILGKCVGMGYVSKHVKQPGPFGVLREKSYRTGDLVRADKNKMLYFIGRVDRQCKINGYRVELEEIEKEIEKLDGIREARVIVKKEQDNFSRLYAFYTGAEKENLKQYLKEKLPHYMVPQEIWHCDEFPITQNGKVDYSVLLKQAENEKQHKEEEIGAYMLRTIEGLLNRTNCNVEESFFEAGGDSITLLALVSELSGKFHVNIDISRLFDCRSIHEMVAYVIELANAESRKGAAGKKAEMQDKAETEGKTESRSKAKTEGKTETQNKAEIQGKIEARGKTETNELCTEPPSKIPIIEPQKKLYQLEKRAAKGDFGKREALGFSLLFKITFSENIDTARLEQCINRVIRNNEIFYTGLQGKHSRIYCYKKEDAELVKIRQGTEESAVWEELSYFSLDSGSILEVVQYGERVLYLQVKHVYLDFISVQYFMDDVVKLYGGQQEKKERIGFFDYLNRNDFEEEEVLTYWQSRLKLCPVRTRLPIPGREVPSLPKQEAFRILRRKCQASVYQKLKKIAKQKNSSVFLVLLCYFVHNLRKYCDSDYLRIGCYCPGRNYKYDNGVMGMFTNVLPFVCKVSEGSLFDTVKREMLAMLQHQNISQSRLYQSVPLEEISDGELFDICFNYQNDWLCVEEKNASIERIETLNANPDVTRRNFYFGVIEENGELLWEVSYNQGCYTEGFVEEFIAGMQEDILNGSV